MVWRGRGRTHGSCSRLRSNPFRKITGGVEKERIREMEKMKEMEKMRERRGKEIKKKEGKGGKEACEFTETGDCLW